MKTLELEEGQLLKGADLNEWEMIDPDMPVDAARNWVLNRVPYNERHDHESETHLFLFGMTCGDRGAVVVRAPNRDLQMALAIRRSNDTFQLIGRREVVRKR